VALDKFPPKGPVFCGLFVNLSASLFLCPVSSLCRSLSFGLLSVARHAPLGLLHSHGSTFNTSAVLAFFCLILPFPCPDYCINNTLPAPSDSTAPGTVTGHTVLTHAGIRGTCETTQWNCTVIGLTNSCDFVFLSVWDATGSPVFMSPAQKNNVRNNILWPCGQGGSCFLFLFLFLSFS